MPDLGKYATDVLLAYGVSAVVLLLFVGLSIFQAKSARKRLETIEKKNKGPQSGS